MFYEYFHGDNGAGLGASHQTGWTGGIAVLMKLFGSVASDQLLKTEGREELFRSVTKKPEKNPKEALNKGWLMIPTFTLFYLL